MGGRLLFSVAFAGLALSWVGASPAGAASIIESKHVRGSSLDLSQDHDAGIMAERIRKAALEVCGAGRGSLQIVSDAVLKSECWGQAVNNAADALGAPKVTRALGLADDR